MNGTGVLIKEDSTSQKRPPPHEDTARRRPSLKQEADTMSASTSILTLLASRMVRNKRLLFRSH